MRLLSHSEIRFLLSSSPSRLNFAEMLRKADEVCDATGLSCYPAFLGTDNAAIAAYAG